MLSSGDASGAVGTNAIASSVGTASDGRSDVIVHCTGAVGASRAATRTSATVASSDVFEKLPGGVLAAYVDPRARFVDIGTPESWSGAARIVAGENP